MFDQIEISNSSTLSPLNHNLLSHSHCSHSPASSFPFFKYLFFWGGGGIETGMALACRVSKPARFEAAPGIFYPEPAPEQNVGIFLKLTTNCLKYVLTHVPVHVGHILFLLKKKHKMMLSFMSFS